MSVEHRKRSRHSDPQSRRSASARRADSGFLFIVVTVIVAVVLLIVAAASLLESDDAGSLVGSQNPGGGGGADDSGGTVIGTSVGQTAPDFHLVDLDGRAFTLSSYRGKVVVLDFMATWCGPCRDEMAHLQDIFDDPAYANVEIVSIDVDDSETDAQLRGFKGSYGGDWTFATNGGSVGRTYGASSIPTLYIIDAEGRVAYSTVGLTPSSTLKVEIDKAL